MRIKKDCFGGYIGFYLRKLFPKTCSNIYLLLQRKKTNKIIKDYIENNKIDNYEPLFISIETINRCNGTCVFCPCNIHDEQREYKYMPDKLFKKIISDLKEMDYHNYLMLLANNEILLDKNVMERLKYARDNLPKAKMKMFTNGKLLTLEKFKYIIDNNLVDEIVINNYNSTPKLNPSIEKIYQAYKDVDIDTDVTISIRYSEEVLSNRANSSPNKTGQKIINDYCALPFTDININPEGKLLICCCDAIEKTNLGDVNTESLKNLFNGKKYVELRKKMLKGRANNNFCKYCDFNDVGTRKNLIIEKLRGSKNEK